MSQLKQAIGAKSNQQKNVVSIDIGFGYTKCAFEKASENGKKIENLSFPSIISAAIDKKETEISILTKRKTAKVRVKGKYYEVGPDIDLVQTTSGSRHLSEDYAESVEHEALLKGALKLIGIKEIDLLVVGLPVKHMEFEEKVEALKRTCIGTHMYEDETIVVHDVTVVEQPMGGYINYMLSTQCSQNLKNEFSLVIDAGQQTIDWIGVKGTTPMPGNMGSHPQSMGKIINLINEAVSTRIREHYDDALAIESAIESGSLYIKGEDVPIEEFFDGVVDKTAEQTLAIVKSKVQTHLSKVRNVILVGGPSKFFYKHAKNVFKDKNVIACNNSMFSNVNGYQLIGNIKANRKS
ncbi:hypothetical protein A3715_17205 [Oleiphilus sp. HI0009]|nr:hypothetical protein A3715_17205 [Oleiphilus sp. HI0009]